MLDGKTPEFNAPMVTGPTEPLVGVSVGSDDPDVEPPPDVKTQTKPRRGPCPRLARRIYAARGEMYPFSAWNIESVKISKDGRTAEAVTMDGSAGLKVIDSEWRILWAFDAPPS